MVLMPMMQTDDDVADDANADAEDAEDDDGD